MSVSNRRAHFRVPYPVAERPRLVFGATICEVVDCSERGVRFVPPPLRALSQGTRIEARLRFPRGEEVPLCGTVVHAEGGCASLRLEGDGIPFASILREQIYLRRLQRRAADAEAAAAAAGD